MKVSYVGKTVRVYREDGTYYTIIPKKDFDKLLSKGITRKKAREYNIGSTLWNNSSTYHYNPEELEKQRLDKIKTTNSINRFKLWEDNLLILENISPGITELFKQNIRNNPEKIINEIERLNDMFHEMKLFIRQSKKYIRQACIRKGVKYPKLVANSSEYILKKLLIELGYKPIIQPYINKLWYDFQVGDLLIELDGSSYHTDEGDTYKENIAKKLGYKIIRINCDELKDIETLKDKLKKCLQKVKY